MEDLYALTTRHDFGIVHILIAMLALIWTLLPQHIEHDDSRQDDECTLDETVISETEDY